MNTSHEAIYEQLEAFAFGTLIQEEADNVVSHLNTGCPVCSARLKEATELSVCLAASVNQHEPSAVIGERLMKRVYADSGPIENASAPKGHSQFGWWAAAVAAAASVVLFLWGHSLRNDLSAVKTEQGSLLSQIDRFQSDLSSIQKELSTLTQKQSFNLELEGLRAEREKREREIEQLQNDHATNLAQISKLERDLHAYEDATVLLGQPGMKFVDLSGVEPNRQAFGKVVIDPIRGTGVVYMYQLPQTPEGKVYQAWSLRDGKPTSVGRFTVAPDGSAVLKMNSLPDPSHIASFQVTIETAGGEEQPTGMMYLTGPDAAPDLK
ncbi:MAG: anti-sigma factor [candidate division Zixibacteria bacterium]|nr:anti-sigma factor [candidate division Zixibacteria bacterium]